MDQSYAPDNTSEFFRPEVTEKWNKLMPSMDYPDRTVRQEEC